MKKMNRIYFGLASFGLAIAVFAAVKAYAGTSLNSVQGFSVSCPVAGGANQEIKPMFGQDFSGYKTFRCSMAMSPVAVYVGGSNVTASTFTGYRLCEDDSCTDTAITIDASQGRAYCISADPVQTGYLNCIAGN